MKRDSGLVPRSCLSISDNIEYIDGLVAHDPTEEWNSKIDFDILLKRVGKTERKILKMLRDGYTYEEIGAFFGISKQRVFVLFKQIKDLFR